MKNILEETSIAQYWDKDSSTNLIAHHLTTHITYVVDIVVPSNGKWYIARKSRNKHMEIKQKWHVDS